MRTLRLLTRLRRALFFFFLSSLFVAQQIDTATPSVRLEKLAAAVRSENRLSELFFLLFIVAFFGVIALPDWVLTVNR
jgi:hypothetical protein